MEAITKRAKFSLAEHVGENLVFRNIVFQDGRLTRHGKRDAVIATVDHYDDNAEVVETWDRVVILNAAVVRSLRQFAGRAVMGKPVTYDTVYGTTGIALDPPDHEVRDRVRI